MMGEIGDLLDGAGNLSAIGVLYIMWRTVWRIDRRLFKLEINFNHLAKKISEK